MKHTDRINVAVLYGGQSTEHEVSLQSAKNVIENLDKNLFDVTPIGINKQGHWFIGDKIFQDSLKHNKILEVADPVWFSPNWMAKNSEIELATKSNSITQYLSQSIDVIFPAVHGNLCEDGALQGLLELANLPYVGCGILASAVCMDKDFAKRLVSQAGINVGNFYTFHAKSWHLDEENIKQQISEQLVFPVYVKPVNAGSSVGISRVATVNELKNAINFALQFDKKIIVESEIIGQELEVAILEPLDQKDDLIISIVGEIKSNLEFYSYEAKYLDEKGADLIIPARIPENIKETVKKAAGKIFQILDCDGMARVDFFYDKQNSKIIFNEINTLPGFTKISMYPKLLGETGINYSKLLTHLILLAINKNNQKKLKKFIIN